MRYIQHAVGNYTVFHNGSHTFTKEHIAYKHLIDAMKEDNIEKFLQYIDQRKSVFTWSNGNLKIVGDDFFYKEELLHGSLVEAMLAVIKNGDPCEKFVRFIEKIGENPSLQSVNEFLTWLGHKSFIILDNGNFLGYKSVKVWAGNPIKDARRRNVKSGDYVDWHSSKFRNNVGDLNYMARDSVHQDKNVACSTGFHIGTLDFAQNFCGGANIVLCEVDPKNVVSVPIDSNNQKVRVCRYKVHSKL
jgi:hypothetical protein